MAGSGGKPRRRKGGKPRVRSEARPGHRAPTRPAGRAAGKRTRADAHNLGSFAATRDITARKRAEERIERLSRFPSENPNPVLRVSAQGVPEYANAASDALLG